MTSPPIIPTSSPLDPPGVVPRSGEIAFAVSVSTLYDLTLGNIQWAVWFRKTTSPTPGNPDETTLTLSNRVPGGAVLDILNADEDEVVTRFTNEGLYQTEIGGWVDFHYQPAPPNDPPAPLPGSDEIRMYAADGRLWFKVPGNPTPLLIPFDTPPGPAHHVTYWMGGG